MKRTRWLLLVAIAAIAFVVATSYISQKKILQTQAPVRPRALPANISAAASKWVWSERVGGNASVEIRASSFRQVKNPSRFDLEDVELRIFDKRSAKFDLVKSAKATFNPGDGNLYSEGAVDITMNMPADDKPAGRLVNIQSSQVTFNSRTAVATTEAPARFKFDQGYGASVGAHYDSTNRELILKNQVSVTWTGAGPGSKPMTVEAGQMIYKEAAAQVLLFPWSRLKKEGLTLDAADSIVHLKKGMIDFVDARQARGTDVLPARSMEFGARDLHMEFAEKGEVKKITGTTEARLVSRNAASETAVTADRLDMEFEPSGEGSEMKQAFANGHSVVESRPLPQENKLLPEARVLRSEAIAMKMRPGGREIEAVETYAPGQVEFLPVRAGQRKRTMNGERIWVKYGDTNLIQSVRSVNVTTRTEPEKDQKKGVPSTTASLNMLAHFDSKGQMANMEQWGNFHYEAGPRKATAEHAKLDQAANVITLTGAGRVWDDTGSVTANTIVLDQKSDDFSAEGNVASSRTPDQKGGTSMLTRDEPVQARAARMTSRDRNRQVHYEGNAVMWQGANRIQADFIDIDRRNGRLRASGSVVSQFVDKAKDDDDKKAAPRAPVYTVIRAPLMEYFDSERMAHYSGGSKLNRPNLDVTSAEIRAWLKPDKPKPEKDKLAAAKTAAAPPAEGDDDDSGGLDHVFADGQVRIHQTSPVRARTGTGEHSEYYADDEKVILTGGSPLLVDTLRGQTRGRVLTWYAQDDRLLVDNTGSGPAVSRIVKKKK